VRNQFEQGFRGELEKAAKPSLSPDEYVEQAYRTSWMSAVVEGAAPKEYEKGRKRCNAAIAYWKTKERPLEILMIHGSGRDRTNSCAGRESNSTRLLREGVKVLDGRPVNVSEVHLRDRKYNRMEACNNCLSTASSLCGYSCDCFPLTGEPAQLIYPKILKADVILMSSGVKQASMDSRLKTLLDRLISLDGGYEREEWKPKTQEFISSEIKRSREHVDYIPRLAGRVVAYFLSSKDQMNPDDQEKKTDYTGMVAESLWTGNDAYLMHHPDPYYVCFYGKWDEDYSHDAARMLKMKDVLEAARQLVLSTVEMAVRFRTEGYPPIKDRRVNRT